MRHYPDLSQKLLVPLRVVREQLRLDPGFLDDPTCPYPADVLELLKHLAPAAQAVSGQFLRRSGSKHAILEDELQDLYLEIRDFGKKLSKDDVTEFMSYFRTRTTLLEKLVSLTERAVSVKEAQRFQDIVMGILEDMLSPDQRAEALELLAAALEPQDSDD